jgi:hypothetical protein
MDTISGAAMDADCPICPGSPHDVAHIFLTCTSGADDRRRIFDGHPINARLLQSVPEKVCAFLRTIGFLPYSGFAAKGLNKQQQQEARLGGLMAQGDATVDLPSATAPIKAEARRAARVRFMETLLPTHQYSKVCDGKPLPRDINRSPQEERALRLLRVDRHPGCMATLARW